jgi:hypothetical protein
LDEVLLEDSETIIGGAGNIQHITYHNLAPKILFDAVTIVVIIDYLQNLSLQSGIVMNSLGASSSRHI